MTYMHDTRKLAHLTLSERLQFQVFRKLNYVKKKKELRNEYENHIRNIEIFTYIIYYKHIYILHIIYYIYYILTFS